MFFEECATSEIDRGAATPTLSPIQTFARSLQAEAIRGAKAIDRCLNAFYLPMEAQERKRKCSPDDADAIRLHGLGVRW